MKHVFEVFVKTWSKLKNWTETEKSGPKMLKIIKAKNNDYRAIQIHENDLKLFSICRSMKSLENYDLLKNLAI